MGKSKQEFERMRYVIFTEPLTEKEFVDDFFQQDDEGTLRQKASIRDWNCEEDDYNELFKDDPKYKELNSPNPEKVDLTGAIPIKPKPSEKSPTSERKTERPKPRPPVLALSHKP